MSKHEIRNEFLADGRAEKGQVRIAKRYNPFGDILSLGEILELEEAGHIKKASDITEKIAKIMEKVFDEFSGREQDFVRRHFYMGESIAGIAKEWRVSEGRVEVYKKSVTKILKVKLQGLIAIKNKQGEDLVIFQRCPLCVAENAVEIDKFILDWLEQNNWHFRGLLKQIRDKFKINPKTLATTITHIKYHMHVDRDEILKKLKSGQKDELMTEEDEALSNMNISVSLLMKAELENLAKKYDLTLSALLRLSWRVMMPMVKAMLESNQILADELEKLGRRSFRMEKE